MIGRENKKEGKKRRRRRRETKVSILDELVSRNWVLFSKSSSLWLQFFCLTFFSLLLSLYLSIFLPSSHFSLSLSQFFLSIVCKSFEKFHSKFKVMEIFYYALFHPIGGKIFCIFLKKFYGVMSNIQNILHRIFML